MIRRALLALIALAPVALARPTRAGSGGGATEAATFNLPPVGLPVIEGGRVRNYVFVSARLHLGAGRAPESLRPKAPHFRDVLVRAAHQTPFTRTDTWLELNGPAMAAVLMRAAPALVGRGAVTRVEIVSQAPRRRTGMRGA